MADTTYGWYFEILDERGCSLQGNGEWHLPTDDDDWMPEVTGSLSHAYHLCHPDKLIDKLGARIFLAQVHPDARTRRAGSFMLASRARLVREANWNETAVLFAADCSEHVLAMFEGHVADDDRPRRCIETMRRFAHGDASMEELDAAGSDAAQAAADAWYNAIPPESAARAVWAASTAADSTYVLVNGSGWEAAKMACQNARIASVDGSMEEKSWQSQRLLELLL